MFKSRGEKKYKYIKMGTLIFVGLFLAVILPSASQAALTLTAPSTAPSGSQPYSAASADFNNDGNKDLISTGYISANAVMSFGDGPETLGQGEILL